MKKNTKFEENKNQVSILFQKYLLNIENEDTLKEIIQIIDENHNNYLELKELKKLINFIETKEFKKDLSNYQNNNLIFLIKNIKKEIEKLEKKFFFKKITISDFIKNINKEVSKKSMIFLSSGCCGVNFF
jgi:hypothetical protein